MDSSAQEAKTLASVLEAWNKLFSAAPIARLQVPGVVPGTFCIWDGAALPTPRSALRLRRGGR